MRATVKVSVDLTFSYDEDYCEGTNGEGPASDLELKMDSYYGLLESISREGVVKYEITRHET